VFFVEKIYDMLIVGGGPGGYTAALYAARAGLSTLVLEKLSAGGQMALTDQVDNYPGYPEGVDGFELGMRMQQGAERFGSETVLAEVYEADLAGPVKTLRTSEGDFYGKTVVLATGAKARKLGLDREDAFTGRGVHYCAHCDGMFYRNKTVVVVGGGNTAVADALILSRFCKKVYLVHRRDALRATKVYHQRLLEAENIEILWNSALSELQGEGRLSGVRVKDVLSGAEREVACDGVFVSIGRDPESMLFRGQLSLDASGYVVADESTKTSVAGVFAVGDLRTKALRQIITAAADGAMAAHAAEEYLAENA
jgi:thioredoxin reductase (NADPH)